MPGSGASRLSNASMTSGVAQRHGREAHNMAPTPEQVLAVAVRVQETGGHPEGRNESAVADKPKH